MKCYNCRCHVMEGTSLFSALQLSNWFSKNVLESLSFPDWNHSSVCVGTPTCLQRVLDSFLFQNTLPTLILTSKQQNARHLLTFSLVQVSLERTDFFKTNRLHMVFHFRFPNFSLWFSLRCKGLTYLWWWLLCTYFSFLANGIKILLYLPIANKQRKLFLYDQFYKTVCMHVCPQRPEEGIYWIP